MSKIVIIGAGAMGSAFALPCLDNNHDRYLNYNELLDAICEADYAELYKDITSGR